MNTQVTYTLHNLRPHHRRGKNL